MKFFVPKIQKMEKEMEFPISRDNHITIPLYVILSEVEVLLSE